MALKNLIVSRIEQSERTRVWTAFDFLDLGNRDAVDKTLQRLVNAKVIRRVSRGLYDVPQKNALTGELTAPDYRQVIEAISRRDQARMLIDGLTSANELGLTNAVPGQVNVLTDCYLKPVKLGNLTITFKYTAPSKLYWAGRPAMRVVQALHWLKDIIQKGNQTQLSDLNHKLFIYLDRQKHKDMILNDLQEGLPTLPAWMQAFIKALFLTLKNQDE